MRFSPDPEFPIWTSGPGIVRFSFPSHNAFAAKEALL
jgi:hypothetical protein